VPDLTDEATTWPSIAELRGRRTLHAQEREVLASAERFLLNVPPGQREAMTTVPLRARYLDDGTVDAYPERTTEDHGRDGDLHGWQGAQEL
jgi:hypothetical protein